MREISIEMQFVGAKACNYLLLKLHYGFFGFRFFVLDQIKSSTPTLNGLKVEGTVSPRMCAFLYFVF